MYIITQQGSTIGHKIGAITLGEDSIQVVIESQSLEPQPAPGGMSISNWSNTLTLPLIDLGDDYKLAVANFLVSPGQPFEGGTIVSDEEFAFTAKSLDMLLKVEQRRDTNIKQEYTFNGVVYPSDWNSLTLIIGYALKAKIKSDAGQSFSLAIPNAEGGVTTHTAGQILGNADAMLTHTAQQYAHAQSLKTTIEAATDVAGLEAIDIETGWPE